MRKEDKRKIAVAILPWAGLKKNTQVGPVTFWPWDPSQVDDVEIKDQLKRFFKIFVDHYGKPANTITICSHGRPDFRILEEKEYKELLAAIDILAFSSICPKVKQGVCSNNNSIAPPNAEYFDFFGQTFQVPDDSSVVVPTPSTHHWEEIDKVHISMPWGVSNQWGTTPKEELIEAFHKVFDTNFPEEVRERLFRSLEWFRFAHAEANNVSDASRLVMMSTAFEILLAFPERQKSRFFANEIDDKLKKDKSITETRSHNNKRYTCIKAAWWAYDFYQLRNKIVHGAHFNPEDGRYKEWINYNIVADLVFWEFIVRELFENTCLDERTRRCVEKFKPHIKDGTCLEEFSLNWTMGFDDYHKALDWVSV